VTQAQVLESGEARWKGALQFEQPEARSTSTSRAIPSTT
jgi:hypothetical protein